MKRLRSPLWYVGGKGAIASRIIDLFPAHTTYVEPFGGAASVLLGKRASKVEVYNDLHSGVVTFFRVLRSPRLFERFYDLVRLTPYSREEFFRCYDTWRTAKTKVAKAHRWFVASRMSFGGLITRRSWGFRVQMSSTPDWLSAIALLPEIAQRFREVQIENRDFRKIFKLYDTPETLFYCDPPYVPDSRVSNDVYEHEMTSADHEELVALCLGAKGKIMISGYDNPIYRRLEQEGWTRREFSTRLYAAGSTKAQGPDRTLPNRTEIVWISANAHKKAGFFE